jgi:uncharacterized protein
MSNRGLGQSGYVRRLTRLQPSFGRWLLLAWFLLPISASAQFFDDQPMRRGRQPGFGAFGFPNQMQQPAFGGFGPEVQHPEAPGLSRFPARARVMHRQPPRIDYSHAPPPEQQNPSPQRRILVLGDAMADWLGYGLEQALSDQPDLGVTRKINTDSGLLKYRAKNGEPANWIAAAKQIMATEKADAVVVMLGMNDRIAVHETTPATSMPKANNETDKPRAPDDDEGADAEAATPDEKDTAKKGTGEFRDERWVSRYAKAIRQMTRALREHGIPVIWVGLPAIEGQQSTSDMLFLNTLFREGAAKNGATYVDVWNGFADEGGRFVQYGPDFEGQTRRLRSPDGVFFTKPGARKLAHYVEREIQRVLAVKPMPVAPTVERTPSASKAKPLARPMAGPVVPLVEPVVATQELLGGGASRGIPQDPLVARTLVIGAPLSAPAGRADDYAWPRREIGNDPARDTPVASNAPAISAEPATIGQAASLDIPAR